MRTRFSLLAAFFLLLAQLHATPPSACDIPSGLKIDSLAAGAAWLSWSPVIGAVQYELEVEDEQNNPSTFKIEIKVSGTQYHVTGLTAGVLYKFKVRTRCADDKSDWSSWKFFTAASGNSGNPGNPGNPSAGCAVPQNLKVMLNGGIATLSWSKVSGANHYYIEVEDEQNNPSNFHIEQAVNDTSVALSGLQTGVLYKFKVRSHCDSSQQSIWSPWLFFSGSGTVNNPGSGSSNGACSKPAGLTVLNITQTGATLRWDSVPGALSYTIEVERNPSGANPWKITVQVNATSYVLTNLSVNTRYKFKVRTNCSSGHSDWAEWRKFKTAPAFSSVNSNSNLIAPAAATANEPELQVWPNPAADQALVGLKGLGQLPATLRLFHLSGQLALEQIIDAETDTWQGQIDVSQLPAGLYFLQVQSGTARSTQKLVVE